MTGCIKSSENAINKDIKIDKTSPTIEDIEEDEAAFPAVEDTEVIEEDEGDISEDEGRSLPAADAKDESENMEVAEEEIVDESEEETDEIPEEYYREDPVEDDFFKEVLPPGDEE